MAEKLSVMEQEISDSLARRAEVIGDEVDDTTPAPALEEETAETPAPEAEAPAATEEEAEATDLKTLPDWSKPMQAVQQENANLRKAVEQTNTQLATLLARLEANPTAANQAAAEKVEAKQDELAEIEARLADPKFDPLESAPLLKTLVSTLKSVREELAATKAIQKNSSREDDNWGRFATEHPTIGRDGGKAIMQEAIAEVEADRILKTVPGAATTLFWQKVRAKAKAPAAAPAPTPNARTPVTSSGGRMTPPGANGVKPKPPARTLDDEVKAGKFGLVDEFL